MITLEQVRALDARVQKALGAIERLTAENSALRESVQREQKRAADLERTIEDFRREQSRIEEGILHALERLNAFEDAILDSAPASGERAAAPRNPSARPAAKPEAPASPPAGQSASVPEDGAAPEPRTAGAELEIF